MLTHPEAEEAEVFVNVTIDIGLVDAGLPVTSTLYGEIINPDGEGVNTCVLHRGFVQSAFQPSLHMGFDEINAPVTSAGAFGPIAVDSAMPPSPHANDSYDRLRVASGFTIPPGDTYLLRGNHDDSCRFGSTCGLVADGVGGDQRGLEKRRSPSLLYFPEMIVGSNADCGAKAV